MLVGWNYEAAVQMIRAVPRRISLSHAFDRHRVFNGQMSHVINWIRIRGAASCPNRCKMFRPLADTGANVRRGLSEYSGENAIDIVFFSNWFWNIESDISRTWQIIIS